MYQPGSWFIQTAVNIWNFINGYVILAFPNLHLFAILVPFVQLLTLIMVDNSLWLCPVFPTIAFTPANVLIYLIFPLDWSFPLE